MGRDYHAARAFTVDYHKPSRAALDQVHFCPASVPGIHELSRDVWEVVRILELQRSGRPYYRETQGELSEAWTEFALEVEAAQERLQAEIRAAYRQRGGAS